MMETAPGIYLTAFLVGLLGGVHCLSMCGGLVGSLTLGLDPRIRRDPLLMLPYQLTYNLARIAGYATAGALFGGLGALLLQLDAFQIMQRVLYGIAGVVMILLGLYLGGWWRLIAVVERAGAVLWRRLEPLGRRVLPVRNLMQAAALGYLWAWIPCGLVYSVLITAVATGSVLDGALVMLAFGAGTLPNLLGIGLLAGAAARISERAWVKQVAGLLVIGFGLYALWQLY
ncbi:sulfite exporter TauE/SafE family protein [Thiocapsa bogorovii]|uniref:sulfite exporter TauE/SafE family protein n=1 Tax=Thiocapsa bogorovii TaxID=521689 RepID=UPI001E415917|nr:sulfite exporter TauE/SafE family protein [Thiocapsa bogorovii]UHD14283.1 sulfite exporter TauE/SafE family protein [Thiocapsa bogorovii]